MDQQCYFFPAIFGRYNHFSIFLFFDGQIFRKGKKSRLFYTFCQLHLDVAIRTHFYQTQHHITWRYFDSSEMAKCLLTSLE